MKKLSFIFGIAMLMLGIFASGAGNTSAAALTGRVEAPIPCSTCIPMGNVNVVVRGFDATHAGLTPIAGADVVIFSEYGTGPVAGGTTDASGNFSANIPAGDYTVHITAPGFGSDTYDTNVVQHKTTTLNAVLYASNPSTDPSSDPSSGPCPTCISSR